MYIYEADAREKKKEERGNEKGSAQQGKKRCEMKGVSSLKYKDQKIITLICRLLFPYKDVRI